MAHAFCKSPLWESAKELIDVALGKRKADMVIVNANLINVCTGEIEPDTGVAVAEGRIAMIGDVSGAVGENTLVYDAAGQYLAPGFTDGHMHIESSMLTVGEYARAVIPHGTIGIYPDPHEICNVLGMSGLSMVLEDAAATPLKVFMTVPSCVPAMPGFEDSGAALGLSDIRAALEDERVVGLGEMMNYPGVFAGADALKIVGATLRAGKIATGHFPVENGGASLDAYIASGVRCCHESTRAEDALEKMRRGMYAMMREGSAWRDIEAVAPAITAHKVDSRFATLVSDDAHPNTLASKGHMDHIVRRAVEEGIDPVTAIQMATINTAQCFHMDHELGSITPGKCADMVLLNDLDDLRVTSVWIDGVLSAKDGEMVVPCGGYRYPDKATHTMNLGCEVTADRLRIEAPAGAEEVRVNVIDVIPSKAGTRHSTAALRVNADGTLSGDPEQDILKVAVFERHHATGTSGLGFVRGFGIRRGAMASTVAHDAHNLLVVGASDEDMVLAARTLIECGGGMVVVLDGRVLGCVPLNVAGLMSERPLQEVRADVIGLEQAWKEIGCPMESPFMTMALLCLACIPELRLTNRGLVDCVNFSFIPLICE